METNKRQSYKAASEWADFIYDYNDDAQTMLEQAEEKRR